MGAFSLPPLGDVGGPQFENYGDTGFGPIGGAPQLPSFENTAPTLPNVTVAPTPAANNGVTFQNPFLNKLATGINSGVNLAKSSGSSLLKISAESVVLILIGLLLIAAGLFSFDKVRDVAISAARTGAEVAA